MKKEDEIMAEYLLKGGKMLSKTCPSCGCPLFEYKGETFCVVCRAESASGEGEQLPLTPGISPEKGPSYPGQTADLACSLEETLIALALRIRQESDPEQVMVLMNSLKRGIEALKLLRQS